MVVKTRRMSRKDQRLDKKIEDLPKIQNLPDLI